MRGRKGELHFRCLDADESKPRHASIPRWHLWMVLDEERNSAYDRAIRRAVEMQHMSGEQAVHVLDIGTGCGLLSMFAARSGIWTVALLAFLCLEDMQTERVKSGIAGVGIRCLWRRRHCYQQSWYSWPHIYTHVTKTILILFLLRCELLWRLKESARREVPLSSSQLSPCRAGASKVTGVEISQHLSDVAAESFVRNGYGLQCRVINKDVRHIGLNSADEPETGLEQKADLCVFEVITYLDILDKLCKQISNQVVNTYRPDFSSKKPKGCRLPWVVIVIGVC